MLQELTRDTTTTPIAPNGDELGTRPGHGAQNAEVSHDDMPFTDAQAWTWLVDEKAAGRAFTIRSAAAAWNWSKGKAERFIAKANAAMTGAGTQEPSLFAAVAKPSSADVAAAVATGVAQARRLIDEQRAERERKHDEELDERDKTFDAKNPNLLVCEQPATVVHWNMYDQVVILQRADFDEDGNVVDPFVIISRDHLPKLIAKLTAMLRETQV